MLALSAGLGGMIGGDIASISNDMGQVEWNYLTHRQLKEKIACYGTIEDCRQHVAKYDEISKKQDEQLKNSCANNVNSSKCHQMIHEALEYIGEYRDHYGKRSDIIPSTKSVLEVANTDGYHTINSLQERANYFGAMYGYTEQPWFRVAEDVSRNDLQGFMYSSGTLMSIAYGPPLNSWRDEAGAIIMKDAKLSFQNIYKNPNQGYEWSIKRLHDEQSDPNLQTVHEKWYQQWNPIIRKLADRQVGGELLNPKDRINTGCEQMPEVKGCKVK